MTQKIPFAPDIANRIITEVAAGVPQWTIYQQPWCPNAGVVGLWFRQRREFKQAVLAAQARKAA